MSGKEIAEKMLADNRIYDVQVVSVQGTLTDHYNPMNKTVNLSPEVYHGRSAAAAAVAAHEVGHAVQHATSYSFLKFRSAMVPLQNVSSKVLNFVIMVSLFGGFLLFSSFPTNLVLMIIIACYSVITLFSLVTLPVEFDASFNRALPVLKAGNYLDNQDMKHARKILLAAALTYVAQSLSGLFNIWRWITIFRR